MEARLEDAFSNLAALSGKEWAFMKLHTLLEGILKTEIPDINVVNITDNSKKIEPGTLFVCVCGNTFDGHDYAKKAIELGAVCIISEKDLGLEQQIIVDNSRETYGELCASWFNHPERRLKLIGVTGTNGKTTITTLMKDILTRGGHKVGLIGTIQNEIGSEIVHTENTTPMAFQFMELLDKMVKFGCDCAVMEVSSFSLVQYRICTAYFKIAIFTNLTPEHLDYHKSMESYYEAKKMLFSRCDLAIINTDEYGKRLLKEINCEKFSYGIKDEYFHGEDVELLPNKLSYNFCMEREKIPVTMNLVGMFNVQNSIAAIAACVKLGMPLKRVVDLASECQGVKGRCEVIPTDRDFSIICDYAHTPDALENILSTVRGITKGRLISVFGCGGNRDSAKRPLMGAISAKYADVSIITSDNPRDEDPEKIIADIVSGVNSSAETISVVDRKNAIAYAIKEAKPKDVIVLAGKGHEDYQVLANNEHISFDERVIVKEILEAGF